MRLKRLKKLWKRLQALQHQNLTRDQLLLAKPVPPRKKRGAYFLVDLHRKELDQAVTPETFSFSLRRQNCEPSDAGKVSTFYAPTGAEKIPLCCGGIPSN
ncbi:MAG: hypothetical protein ACRERU_20365 [Methylococcales bacterium]